MFKKFENERLKLEHPLRVLAADIGSNYKDLSLPEGIRLGSLTENLKLIPGTSSRLNTGGAEERSEQSVSYTRQVIRDNCVKAIDPWAGRTLKSRHSIVSPGYPWINVPVYGYRFEGKKIFYRLLVGHSVCRVLGVLLPEDGILIVPMGKNTDHSMAVVDTWRDFLLSHWQDALMLWNNEAQATPSVLISTSHLAHHLWNELPVIDALTKSNDHKKLCFYERASPYGPLTTLFPEIQPKQIIKAHVNWDSYYQFLLRERAFIVPTGMNFIRRRLLTRILNVAKNQHPLTVINVNKLRSRCYPILWVAIRTDVRTWLNQRDGLSQLLKELHKRYPSLAILFDGFSFPQHNSVDDKHPMVIAERQLVRSISAELPKNIEIRETIGLSLLETLAWTQAADIYISPHGTLQHKVGWFTNIPGIVHTGEHLRSTIASKQHPGTFNAVEGSISPEYVFGPTIRDDTMDARTDLKSYTLEWQAVLEKVEQCLDSRVSRIINSRPDPI